MFRLIFTILAIAAPVIGGTVRVGVFGLFRPQRLTVKPTPGSVIEIEAGSARETLEGGYVAGLHLFGNEIDCTIRGVQTPATRVRVSGRGGAAASFLLSVPGKIERRFSGTLDVTVRDGALEPVVTLELEQLVSAAVLAESPGDAPAAALEAQAIVTRSYLIASGRRHPGFDFCDTTHCQFIREEPPRESPAAQAAEQTRGLVIRYQSRTVAALFSASCGGRTRTLAEVGWDETGYLYASVDCPVCEREAKRWEVRLSLEQAKPILARPGSETARLEVNRKYGWSAIPSENYTIARSVDRVILTGRGSGHGIGMCQMGAAGLAKQGRSASQILQHYFPNASVSQLE